MAPRKSKDLTETVTPGLVYLRKISQMKAHDPQAALSVRKNHMLESVSPYYLHTGLHVANLICDKKLMSRPPSWPLQVGMCFLTCENSTGFFVDALTNGLPVPHMHVEDY